MRHDAHPMFQGLPDAPLVMPKQMLERPRAFRSVFRALLGLFPSTS